MAYFTPMVGTYMFQDKGAYKEISSVNVTIRNGQDTCGKSERWHWWKRCTSGYECAIPWSFK